MQQKNTNKGEEALVPDYTSFDIGAFYYTQKEQTKQVGAVGCGMIKNG